MSPQGEKDNHFRRVSLSRGSPFQPGIHVFLSPGPPFRLKQKCRALARFGDGCYLYVSPIRFRSLGYVMICSISAYCYRRSFVAYAWICCFLVSFHGSSHYASKPSPSRMPDVCGFVDFEGCRLPLEISVKRHKNRKHLWRYRGSEIGTICMSRKQVNLTDGTEILFMTTPREPDRSDPVPNSRCIPRY